MELVTAVTFLVSLLFLGGFASFFAFPRIFELYLKTVVNNSRDTNIIFIVADDLGWNDVSWHNPEMITPNLEKLARGGIQLENYYVQYVCTPSRSAIMTGYYPYHTGLQHNSIKPESPYGLPLKYDFLPQMIKQADYRTHMVGKWHLGFCNWSYTPTHRGFDSFYGYYNGAEDYYAHTRAGSLFKDKNYIDFRNDKKVVRHQNGTYSTFVFAKQVVKIIKHKTKAPLFVYLPFQNVHAPLQVPKRFEDMYLNIKNELRRKYSGMVTAMDEAIGNITKALEEKGILDKTIIIFTTDNGGQPVNGGNNYPLRGTKHTLWEGGTKGVSFVFGKTLAKQEYKYNGLMHVTDWVPTILDIAGIKPSSQMDGMNMWAAINNNLSSPRSEFVYNIDKLDRNGAIRVGNYKLIVGSPGAQNGWYPPPKEGVRFTKNETVINNDLSLFNIATDPNEHNNLTTTLPQIVKELYQKFKEYQKGEVDPLNRGGALDPKADPKHFGGAWSPGWC